MNKLFFLFTLFVYINCTLAKAQVEFGMESGIGSYNMKDLKELNNSILNDMPFDVKVVNDFPAFFYYRPSVFYGTHGYKFGLSLSWQSTGSRISGKDYTGEYKFDMNVKSYMPELFVSLPIISRKIECSLQGTVGISNSNLEIKEYFMVYDTLLTNTSYKFKGHNVALEPGFRIKYPIKKLTAGFYLGYQIMLYSQTFYIDNPRNKLQNEKTKNDIKPNWSGFRMGISINYFVDLSKIKLF